MRYMLLIYSNAEAYSSLSSEQGDAVFGDYFAFTQEIVDSGELVSGDPLQGIETATTVRSAGGSGYSLTDGPFAETKEVLGGYYLVDVKDLDRAIELAARIPAVRHDLGSVEVRPIMDMSGGIGS